MLHYGSIHIQDRDSPVYVLNYNGSPVDLNEMPVDLAKGILDLWEDFEKQLGAVGDAHALKLAQACQKQARDDAGAVVDSVAQRAAKYGAAPTPTARLF